MTSAIGGATPEFLGGPNLSLYLSPYFPFTFSPPSPVSLHTLRSIGPLNTGKGLGALCSPSGVWGGAPTESEFGAF